MYTEEKIYIYKMFGKTNWVNAFTITLGFLRVNKLEHLVSGES